MDSRPYLKTVLYILSLWLLFLSLLIMSYDKVLIKNVWDYIFTENITLSFLFSLISYEHGIRDKS